MEGKPEKLADWARDQLLSLGYKNETPAWFDGYVLTRGVVIMCIMGPWIGRVAKMPEPGPTTFV